MLLQDIPSSTLLLKNLDLERVDWQRYLSWLHDPAVNKFLEVRHQLPNEHELKQYVLAMNQAADKLLLGIFVDDLHIGNIKLDPINFYHRKAILGLMIGDRAFWGKGYATQAIKQLTQYATTELNLHRIEACCYATNLASQQAFLKVGYQREGCFKQAWWGENGYEDNVWLGYVAN